jgi:hypothetical protein
VADDHLFKSADGRPQLCIFYKFSMSRFPVIYAGNSPLFYFLFLCYNDKYAGTVHSQKADPDFPHDLHAGCPVSVFSDKNKEGISFHAV